MSQKILDPVNCRIFSHLDDVFAAELDMTFVTDPEHPEEGIRAGFDIRSGTGNFHHLEMAGGEWREVFQLLTDELHRLGVLVHKPESAPEKNELSRELHELLQPEEHDRWENLPGLEVA